MQCFGLCPRRHRRNMNDIISYNEFHSIPVAATATVHTLHRHHARQIGTAPAPACMLTAHCSIPAAQSLRRRQKLASSTTSDSSDSANASSILVRTGVLLLVRMPRPPVECVYVIDPRSLTRWGGWWAGPAACNLHTHLTCRNATAQNRVLVFF